MIRRLGATVLLVLALGTHTAFPASPQGILFTLIVKGTPLCLSQRRGETEPHPKPAPNFVRESWRGSWKANYRVGHKPF
jgi:hypothetical protein